MNGAGSNAGAANRDAHRGALVLRECQCRPEKVKSIGQLVAPHTQDP
jgi:hypothetical protein